MLKKTISLLGLLAISLVASAAPVNISGTITGGTGALLGLVPPGTPFAGNLDWGAGTLDSAQVNLGAFCFTDDASGSPPASPTCPDMSAVVPMLPTGEVAYNPAGAPPGSTFQQAGTTFDGTTGLLRLATFSPTFNVTIFVDLTFNGDGTGTVFADAGAALGTSVGEFTVARPPVLSTDASIPVMPLFGLVLTGLGLVFVARRQLRKSVAGK